MLSAVTDGRGGGSRRISSGTRRLPAEASTSWYVERDAADSSLVGAGNLALNKA